MRQTHFLFLYLLSLLTAISYGQDNIDNATAVINLTQPNSNTVWNIPNKVALEWNTVHIDTSKTIRFFLVRNEMVVQELGTFKNDGFEEGIELAKNIGSGNRYQVVAIELFPDNKFKIAKKVTPFFTITNAASDERKKKQQLANANPVPVKKVKNKKNSSNTETLVNITPEPAPQIKKEPILRESFEGRKISYTKKFEFDSENIIVKIWDHGRQDGDIVSIYLNGVSVVSKYYLTYFKQAFNIKLNPDKPNDLFLYAHNLGSSPPNTVSLEISDGKKAENIILNSDLQSCEAVLISVK
ncbi:hypothetical protein Q2T41_11550 [Maribacter confluentis]|uniref:Uncharacterized protein n=1 Tax=Maribacter confluentis TaxID=1656093 RepID=A0ABT8RQX8_9FLAO|nr:hypothetical protein [Maribacter confluentis]MDO1513291.1 hypothetical protein [Maribacter confluentis]